MKRTAILSLAISVACMTASNTYPGDKTAAEAAGHQIKCPIAGGAINKKTCVDCQAKRTYQ
ncbi:MAG: hypothetical protein WAX69_12690 [Victivallales bacterium]